MFARFTWDAIETGNYERTCDGVAEVWRGVIEPEARARFDAADGVDWVTYSRAVLEVVETEWNDDFNWPTDDAEAA